MCDIFDYRPFTTSYRQNHCPILGCIGGVRKLFIERKFQFGFRDRPSLEPLKDIKYPPQSQVKETAVSAADQSRARVASAPAP